MRKAKSELQERMSAAEAREHLTVHQNKYGNHVVYIDGKRFPSKKEASRYQELKMLLTAGLIRDLRLQVPFVLIPKSKHGRQIVYKADFVYFDVPLDMEVVEDTKGYRTDVYKLKKRMMAEVFGIIIREV